MPAFLRSKSFAGPPMDRPLLAAPDDVPDVPNWPSMRSSTDSRGAAPVLTRPRTHSLFNRPRTAHGPGGSSLKSRLSLASSFSRPRTATSATAPAMPLARWPTAHRSGTFDQSPDIGVALGSPTHCVHQGRLQPLKPWAVEDLSSAEPSPGSSPSAASRKWKAMGNLLGRLRAGSKAAGDATLTDDAAHLSNTEASPPRSLRSRRELLAVESARPAPQDGPVRYASKWKTPRLSRKSFSRPGSASADNLRAPKSPTWPIAHPPLPPLPKEPTASPRLRVNIPSTHFERYSVMFSSLLNKQVSPAEESPQASLRSRRRRRSSSPLCIETRPFKTNDVLGVQATPQQSTPVRALQIFDQDSIDAAMQRERQEHEARVKGELAHDFIFPIVPTRAPPPPPAPRCRSPSPSFSSATSSGATGSRSSSHFDSFSTDEQWSAESWEDYYLPKANYRLWPAHRQQSGSPPPSRPTPMSSSTLAEPIASAKAAGMTLGVEQTAGVRPCLSDGRQKPMQRAAMATRGQDKPLPSPSQTHGYDSPISPTVAVACPVTAARAMARPVATLSRTSTLEVPPRSQSMHSSPHGSFFLHDDDDEDEGPLVSASSEGYFSALSTPGQQTNAGGGSPRSLHSTSPGLGRQSPLEKAFSPDGSERSLLIDSRPRRLGWGKPPSSPLRETKVEDDDAAAAADVAESGVWQGTPSVVHGDRRESSKGHFDDVSELDETDAEHEHEMFGQWRQPRRQISA